MFRSVVRFLCAGFLLGYSLFAIAAPFQFSNFYFFGDSLTDSAFLPQTDGQVWAQFLGARYGKPVSPLYGPFGNNYAISTATTTSMLFQIAVYFSNGPKKIDPGALYSVWAGPNDFEPCRNAPDPRQCFLDQVPISVGNLGSAVAILGGAGANYILAPNMVDFSKTPEYALNPNKDQVSQGVSLFNYELRNRMNASGYNVIQVDVRSVMDAIIADPTKFGFTNVTDSCTYTEGMSAVIRIRDDCAGYLFWDTLHPTMGGHEVIMYAVASYLEGPVYAATLAEAPFGAMNGWNTALGNELFELKTGKISLPVGRFRPFANTNYAMNREDGMPFDSGLPPDPITEPLGFKSNALNFLVGATYRMNERILVGMAVGRSFNEVKFSRNAGGVNIATNFISAFGGYQFARGYIQAMLTAGLINFNDFTRRIRLRQTIDIWDTATASAQGAQIGGKIETGFRVYERDGFQTGPVANASFQMVRVNTFGERGATQGLNLEYVAQNTRSLVTGLGWQFSHTTRVGSVAIRPYFQATYNREWLRNDRQMGASAVSLLGARAYYVPTPSVTGLNGRNWGIIDVGISARLRQGTMFTLGYQTAVGLKRGSAQLVMASVEIPF